MNKKITLVATPIGNLQDMSLRAIETLKNSDIILCEDTRNSSILLNFYQIDNANLVSYHKFNETKMLEKIEQWLNLDKNISIISDAGMPLISDPGHILVNWCHNNNIEVDAIGGGSAIINAFVLSGFPIPFVFKGFFDSRVSKIQNQIANLEYDNSYIFFVSPHKLLEVLKQIDFVYKDELKVFLVKELTKKFQKYFLGSAKQILDQIGSSFKGEYTIILCKPSKIKSKIKINKYQNYSKTNKTM
ncbi:16S rRNA (cytidine(1402)-2'-O)-methyltransferase [Mesomycoplasma bovoculi]|uniref:Ribosomal RNA small subunit methyltransferase I n=1 Tax=Mesomycoplasma bovoculi M165/69 TaxID=743966 RepID=W5UTP6_9BACT|nr:16S rRNA (cytidine(1402)-2'-O)-methyltransferase [Mesomycoplasma bovoculi]AHH45497.1 ribosomal RNA small subunit methyltransferase I [Mesomycoplasma bovoculi M165/69]